MAPHSDLSIHLGPREETTFAVLGVRCISIYASQRPRRRSGVKIGQWLAFTESNIDQIVSVSIRGIEQVEIIKSVC